MDWNICVMCPISVQNLGYYTVYSLIYVTFVFLLVIFLRTVVVSWYSGYMILSSSILYFFLWFCFMVLMFVFVSCVLGFRYFIMRRISFFIKYSPQFYFEILFYSVDLYLWHLSAPRLYCYTLCWTSFVPLSTVEKIKSVINIYRVIQFGGTKVVLDDRYPRRLLSQHLLAVSCSISWLWRSDDDIKFSCGRHCLM